MARTAIQVYAINLIELARGKVAAHFEPVVNTNCRLVAPPPTRRTAIGGYPKVASYDMLGEQLHYCNPVKHGCIILSLFVFNDRCSSFVLPMYWTQYQTRYEIEWK